MTATDELVIADEPAGTVAQLRESGHLTTKVGSIPVVVFWHEDRPWAIEDRCPHLGFPLHRGSVESGMVTCHWHHARFDLSSGCTLDPWADDARAFDVQIEDDRLYVRARPAGDEVGRLHRRLREGLEENLTLIVAKSVHGLLEHGVAPAEIVRTAAHFGLQNRSSGWGSGLTTLTAMANIVGHLDPDDRALALVHGLVELADDTAGNPPRFPLHPLDDASVDGARLADWYRRFVETRSADSAERALATAVAGAATAAEVEAMMFAAVTDHVYIDTGHTLDFTNKAFELLAHVGAAAAPEVLSSVVAQTTQAERSEELSSWRHPVDLIDAMASVEAELVAAVGAAAGDATAAELATLAEQLLDAEASDIGALLIASARSGANLEQLARAVALAGSMRILRFHVQNDHADWNIVHHSFTFSNAMHQACSRNPTPELARGVLHAAMKVHVDRFLNVPVARVGRMEGATLSLLDECWEAEGHVDEAGTIVSSYLTDGGDASPLIAALGHSLLHEDAGFHWYQLFEASVRHHEAWPAGSAGARLPLVAFARFLAAHTPTRRERSRVVQIAARLRRGDALYEEDEPAT